MFCSEVSKPLIEALNYGFEIGQLSISQKRGRIKLIPKKSEELYYVKNWRPLSLLNWDYKTLATKAVANRLKTHLHKLINNDQTGFLRGRFIGENIRLIVYSTIASFYHIWSRERAKYETVIHCSVPV